MQKFHLVIYEGLAFTETDSKKISHLAFCLTPLFFPSSCNSTRHFFPPAITVNEIQIWEIYSGCGSIIFSS